MNLSRIESELPKLPAIGGHGRSGTTILTHVINSHPEVTLTFEFRCLSHLGKSYYRHIMSVRKGNWWRGPRLVHVPRRNWWLSSRRSSATFLIQYLLRLLPYWRRPIGVEAVRKVLHDIFPNAQIVGDKRPLYHLQLDTLTEIENMFPVVIYRDPRDVALSALRMSQTSWGHFEWAKNVDLLAERWVAAIDHMERYADRIYCLRYEDFVTSPVFVMTGLGEWLGVDPDGFECKRVHAMSIGKYKDGLSADQIERVLAIAGPTMKRLGYI